MNFRIIKTTLLSSFVLTLLLTSCGEKMPGDIPEPTPPAPVGPFEVEIKKSNIKDPQNPEFAYFSFTQNKQLEIKPDAAAESLDWDIAFAGLQGRSNSGSSGKGECAVYRTDTENFDAVKSAEPFIEEGNLWEKDNTHTVVSSPV